MRSRHSWARYRTVVLDSRAEEFVNREQKNLRFEDQWNGVEWILARTPDSGLPRLHSSPTNYLLYVFPENLLAETGKLEVLYSYDEDVVTVHAVRYGLIEDGSE